MKAYRYGIVLIIPPEPHRTVVNALRQAYAWSQSSECDAHASLSVPVPGPVGPIDLRELEERLAGFEPFVLNYGPILTRGDSYVVPDENFAFTERAKIKVGRDCQG